MGGRSSKPEDEEDDDDEEEEDEGEEDFDEEAERERLRRKYEAAAANRAAEAAKKKHHAPIAAPGSIAAISKASVKSVGSVAAPVSAIAKKAAVKAKPAGAKAAEKKEGDVPRGGFGTEWIALEDAIVREGRDLKSAKSGHGIMKGECCTQNGPWRTETSGLLRMPVKTSRGIEGWVTLDARKCRTADGSWGTLAFELASDRAAADLPSAEVKTSVPAVDDDDSDPDAWMDKLDAKPAEPTPPPKVMVRLKAAPKKAVAKKPAPVAKVAAPTYVQEESSSSDEEPAPTPAPAVPPVAARSGKGESKAACEDAVNPTVEAACEDAVNPTAELTDAQKKLRKLKKQLRDIEALEAKLNGSDDMTSDQRMKLRVKPDLMKHIRLQEAAVAREAGVEAPVARRPVAEASSEPAGARKRNKKQNKATGQGGSGAGGARSSKGGGLVAGLREGTSRKIASLGRLLALVQLVVCLCLLVYHFVTAGKAMPPAKASVCLLVAIAGLRWPGKFLMVYALPGSLLYYQFGRQ